MTATVHQLHEPDRAAAERRAERIAHHFAAMNDASIELHALGYYKEHKPQRERMVYFVVGELTGLVKIGSAVDPIDRLRTLQTGSPDRLTLVTTIAGGEKAERALHKQFSGSRVHGEWFSPTPDLLAFIESVI